MKTKIELPGPNELQYTWSSQLSQERNLHKLTTVQQEQITE